MSTKVRPETSRKNDFYISKHRYYELKHFCLQYDEWKEKIKATESTIHGSSPTTELFSQSNLEYSDPTGNQATKLARMKAYCELVEKVAQSSDTVLAHFIFLAVTKDISFTTLKSKYEIPCERDMYYNRYRKFFWLLSELR